jgi:hypothetical protein
MSEILEGYNSQKKVFENVKFSKAILGKEKAYSFNFNSSEYQGLIGQIVRI